MPRKVIGHLHPGRLGKTSGKRSLWLRFEGYKNLDRWRLRGISVLDTRVRPEVDVFLLKVPHAWVGKSNFFSKWERMLAAKVE